MVALPELAVADLAQRARRGDTRAYAKLVDHYRDMVHGLAYHLTGHFEDAEDLTQRSLVQAYSRLSQLRDPGRFPSWLRQVTVNTYRSDQRAARPTLVPIEAGTGTPCVSPGPSEKQLAVREALMSLREPDRLVLILHYLGGYTHAEIGRFLGTAASVVKARLARARARMRREMVDVVSESLSGRRLPASLRDGVIRGVQAMVDDLRGVLPPNVDGLAGQIESRRNAAWREVVAALPEDRRQLRPQGEAQRMRVADLPPQVRAKTHEAMQLMWLGSILGQLTPPRWVPDPDCLWISFDDGSEERGPTVTLADTSAPAGHIISGISLGPTTHKPAPDRLGAPAERDIGKLLESLVEDVTQVATATDAVRTALVRTLPTDVGDLHLELYAEMVDALRAAREHFSEDQERTMAAGDRVCAAELPKEAQQRLHEGVSLYWAACICRRLASRPTWLADPEAASVEFGLYPDWAWLGEDAGREYVIVAHQGGESWQTRIWA